MNIRSDIMVNLLNKIIENNVIFGCVIGALCIVLWGKSTKRPPQNGQPIKNYVWICVRLFPYSIISSSRIGS